MQQGGAPAPAPAEDKAEEDKEDDDWDAAYTPEEQKLAAATGVWRVTYWEDWINAHDNTVKAQSLRGAEVREAKKTGRLRASRQGPC